MLKPFPCRGFGSIYFESLIESLKVPHNEGSISDCSSGYVVCVHQPLGVEERIHRLFGEGAFLRPEGVFFKSLFGQGFCLWYVHDYSHLIH